jgi:hypothetical protein
VITSQTGKSGLAFTDVGPLVVFDTEMFLDMYVNHRIIAQVWKFWLKLYYRNFILLFTFLIKSTISQFNMTDEVKKTAQVCRILSFLLLTTHNPHLRASAGSMKGNVPVLFVLLFYFMAPYRYLVHTVSVDANRYMQVQRNKECLSELHSFKPCPSYYIAKIQEIICFNDK